MPLSDPHYRCTNVDDTPSEDYCHYCFKNGAFTNQGILREEKIAKNINIAVIVGMTKVEESSIAHRVFSHRILKDRKESLL